MKKLLALALCFIVGTAYAQMSGGAMFPGPGVKAYSGGWTPASLTNLAVWYEAGQQVYTDAACTTPATNGNTVLCMKDLSGNGKDLTIASNGPTLSVSGGKSTLNFNGSTHCLKNLSSLGLYANGSASVFIALNSSSPATNKYMVGEGNTTTNSPFIGWVRTDVTTASTSFIRVRNDSSTDLVQATLTTSVFNGTNQVYGLTWDGTTVSPYLNGSASGTTRSLNSGSTITLDNFTLGCDIGNGGSPSVNMQGNVTGWVATKSVMSGSDITSLTNYFSGLQ